MFKLGTLLLAAFLCLSPALCLAETDKQDACPDNSTPVLACRDGATCFTYRAIPRMTKVPKFSDYPAAHAFNGKRAAQAALGAAAGSLGYGLQTVTFAGVGIFILPSTSGAAAGYWSPEPWKELALAMTGHDKA